VRKAAACRAPSSNSTMSTMNEAIVAGLPRTTVAS